MKKTTFDDYARGAGAEAPKPERKTRPGAKDRPTLTVRLTPSQWERIKMLAIQERTSIQSIIEAALETEFKRRGLPW